MAGCYNNCQAMRKSLIVLSLLLPLVLANLVRATAAVGDLDSESPWSSPVTATGVIAADANGVSVGNLLTAAPRFDSILSSIIPALGLAHWTSNDIHRSVRLPIFLLNHIFLI